MPDQKEKVIVQAELGIDVTHAEADFKKLRSSGAQAANFISKGMQALGTSIKKYASLSINNMAKGIAQASKEYKDYTDTIKKCNAQIAYSQKQMRGASEDEKKLLEEKIESIKTLRDLATKQFRGTRTGKVLGGAKALGGQSLNAGKDFWKSGTSMFRKDFETGVKHAALGLGQVLSSTKMTGKWAEHAGKFFWDKARKRWGEQKTGGGVSAKGLGSAALTVGNAAIGGMLKGMGGLLKMLGAMGPLLTMAAGAFGAIVKLMLDAEAAAKDMNKKILETSGSSQIYYKNLQNGNAALSDMGGMLKDIRDSANSLENISWGISKEDHLAVLNAISSEGVQLKELVKQYHKTGDAAKDAEAQASMFGDAVHVAVAYSRQFGVSLQDLSSFQGEMMTQMGQSVDGVSETFHMMTKGAAESGIASNKFFSIIRGVSADLNLYNTRIEDAAHLLTILGKVMSPKNAQQFLSASMNAVKNMGRVERLKVNIMSGGEGKKVVERDIQYKSEDLAKKLSSAIGGAVSPEVLEKSLKDGTADFENALEKAPDDMKGALKDAFLELKVKKSMAKGGVFGVGEAVGETGVGGQLQVMEKVLSKFGGDFSLAREMISDQLGVSIEQSKSLYKLRIAVNDQRKKLKEGLKDQATVAKLQKAGIKVTGDDAASQKAVDEAGYDQILRSMDEDSTESKEATKTEIDYAKDTSQYTSSVSDKISQIFDWLTNKLYDIMTNIYEAVAHLASKVGWGGPDTSKIFQTKGAQAQEKFFYNFPKMLADLQKKQDASTDPKDKANAQKQIDALTTQMTSVLTNMDTQLGGGANSPELKRDRAYKASKDIGLDKGKTTKLTEALWGGQGLMGAVEQANLTGEETAKLLDKLRLSLSGQQLQAFTASGLGGADVSTVPNVGPGPSGQTMASANSGGPSATTVSAAPAAVSPAHAAAMSSSASNVEPVTSDQGEDIVSGLDGLNNSMTNQGIKMNRSFLRNTFWKNGHDAVLDANREALLEYFLYSKMDPNDVAAGLKSGAFTADTLGSSLLSGATATGKVELPTEKVPGHARGGVIPEPKSPDSVFVAARPGETITPKGKGGGGSASLTIPINVNGPGGQELANMMRAAAMNVVVEWQRKQRYT